MRLLRHLVVGLGLLLSAIVHAQTPVPPQLDAWRGWVLKGQEFRACPLIAGLPRPSDGSRVVAV